MSYYKDFGLSLSEEGYKLLNNMFLGKYKKSIIDYKNGIEVIFKGADNNHINTYIVTGHNINIYYKDNELDLIENALGVFEEKEMQYVYVEIGEELDDMQVIDNIDYSKPIWSLEIGRKIIIVD